MDVKIFAYSIVYVAGKEFKEKVPYVVAVLERNGQRFMSRVEGFTEGQTISIGTEVRLNGHDVSGRPIYQF